MFNIIKTNKNKTATAPTYTTMNTTGKNSSSNKKSNAETLKNERIRNKTEKMGFLDKTTIKEEIIPNEAKR
jgi:hypothetical protein